MEFASDWLATRGIDEDDDIYLYFISLTAICFCLLAHVFLLIVFLAWGQQTFATLNAISILVYISLIFMQRKKQYLPVAVLLSAEVTAYAAFNIITTGLSTQIVGFFLMAIIFQTIQPYTGAKIRGTAIAIVLATSLACILYSFNHPPTIAFDPGLQNVLTISNIYIVYIGGLTQFFLGNGIKMIIAKLNKNKMDQLSALANTDQLTGLHNRRFADSFFATNAHQTTRRYCVAMMDIDDFKRINDTYGHECGDVVLQFLARFLGDNLRKSDHVFRWGGEEFLVVLEGVDSATVLTILNKLRERLQETPIPTPRGDLNITITIGVSPLTEDIAECIRSCDDKLYVGKRSGKNVVVT